MSEHTTKSAGDVEDRWTLRAADRALLGNKTGSTRLGFAVLLKLFQVDGRFPRRPEDVPIAAVEALASQVGVPAAAWQHYDWRGRTIEYHRAQIRAALGFREAMDEDTTALASSMTRSSVTPPHSGSAPPQRPISCAASPVPTCSIRPTRPWWSLGKLSGRRSSVAT